MAQRNPNRMSDDELFNDWLVSIQRIHTEMIALGRNRRTFKMMREVVARNARLRETGGHLLEWMFGNYALSTAMSFRRDLDRDKSTFGLRNLLHEIQTRSTIINRARYRVGWNLGAEDNTRRRLCDSTFDAFGLETFPSEPERDHISPEAVRADLERLDETEKVRLFVEQTFAHRARGAPLTVTWDERHTALDVLIGVFERYYLLLAHKTLLSIEPEPQFDTHECLTFPWWELERRND